MNESLQKVQIVARAQAALLRAQLRRSVVSLVLVAVGLVFALLAVGVLNFAAYAGVEMRLGPGPAGLIVGSVDLLLAGALFAKGLATSPPSEEERLDFMKSTRRLGEIAHQVASFAGGPTAELLKFFSRRG